MSAWLAIIDAAVAISTLGSKNHEGTIAKKGLTHSDVARLAHTSRTRVTAILNRNTHDISTDLMLRVLASLGVQAKLQFKSRLILRSRRSSQRSLKELSIKRLQHKCNAG